MEKKFGSDSIKQLIITTICFIGVMICIPYSDYLSRNWKIVVAIAAIILYCLYLLFELFHVSILAKLLLSVFLVALILMIIMVILVQTGVWEKFTDTESMRAFISSMDNYFLMVLIFVLIQFLQVCLIPIPGAVTTAAGSLAFGPLLGALYSFIGIILGSVVAFLVGRKFGHRFVKWMVGEEDLNKALKFVEGRDKIMFFLIFLLPFFPDDALCFVAGLTGMSLLSFVIILSVARVITTLCTVYVVEYVRLLFEANPTLAIILAAVAIAGLCVIFIYGVKYGKEIEDYFVKKVHAIRERAAARKASRRGQDIASPAVSEQEPETSQEKVPAHEEKKDPPQ